jgi:glutamyl/glutaminyl-tRNA synthetase
MSVLEDLKWLGLNFDEGPDSETEFGPYRQSERSGLYKKVADMLLDEGKAYKCFCTKEELEAEKEAQMAAGVSPRYGGKWRDAEPEDVAAMEGEHWTRSEAKTRLITLAEGLERKRPTKVAEYHPTAYIQPTNVTLHSFASLSPSSQRPFRRFLFSHA